VPVSFVEEATDLPLDAFICHGAAIM